MCFATLAETSPPRDVTLVDLDHERILVTWSAPPVSEQSGTITGYQVNVTEVDSGRMWEESSSLPRLMLRNLLPYTTYQVQVRAVPSAGTGLYSAPATETTPPIRMFIHFHDYFAVYIPVSNSPWRTTYNNIP